MERRNTQIYHTEIVVVVVNTKVMTSEGEGELESSLGGVASVASRPGEISM